MSADECGPEGRAGVRAEEEKRLGRFKEVRRRVAWRGMDRLHGIILISLTHEPSSPLSRNQNQVLLVKFLGQSGALLGCSFSDLLFSITSAVIF